jgi:hypothetical protein
MGLFFEDINRSGDGGVYAELYNQEKIIERQNAIAEIC